MRRTIGFLTAVGLATLWVTSFAGFAVLHEYYNALAHSPGEQPLRRMELPAVSAWPKKFHDNLLYIMLIATIAIDVLISHGHRWLDSFFKLRGRHEGVNQYGGMLLSFASIIIAVVCIAFLYANKSVGLGLFIILVAWFVKVIEYYQVEDVVHDLDAESIGVM
jgi:hypothetical protein